MAAHPVRRTGRPWVLAALAFLAFPASGCNDHAPVTSGGPCCDDAAPPVFLASKLDDDDGDGNPYDENYPAINDEDDDIADHAWIRDDDGVFHLYFQNEGLFGPSAIEHYVTRDLTHLTYVGTALRPEPGTWDADGAWSPAVIRAGGRYWMFYTGVEGVGPSRKERIGVAWSHDLTTWSRVPVNNCPGAVGQGCIYECRECWTTWGGAAGSDNQQCRDPFVIRDPDTGNWVMFATARSTNGYATVTVATSADLLHWRGAGFIDATRRLANGVGAQTTGGMAENPFVVAHDGIHTLLFTDWWDPEDSVGVANPRTMVQYATSTSLAADTLGSANWVYGGYTPDPGVNAVEVQRVMCAMKPIWLLSASVARPSSGDFLLHRRQLRLKCLEFQPDGSMRTSNVRLSVGAPGHSGLLSADPSH